MKLSIIILYFSSLATLTHAEDFGVMGSTWKITEKDPIEVIQKKLATMGERSIAGCNERISRQKVTSRINNPPSLSIPRTIEYRQYHYDPSITVAEDIVDHKGQVIHKAGTKVNPLDKLSMLYDLVLFDGNDSEQLDWVLKYYETKRIKPKLILTGGSPILLEKLTKKGFYFDQSGLITKKLGIVQVPAVISQEGQVLLIREIEVD